MSLALAGDGALRESLTRLAEELGIARQVHFLGDVPNVARFLNSLDAFVLNSHSEGMSNTVLEAMACGLPVVATAVGSNPDLLVAGETGLLIPPADQQALKAAIASLAENSKLRRRMGSQGRQRIERQFGIQGMVRAYGQLYSELAERAISAAVRPQYRSSPDLDTKPSV